MKNGGKNKSVAFFILVSVYIFIFYRYFHGFFIDLTVERETRKALGGGRECDQ